MCMLFTFTLIFFSKTLSCKLKIQTNIPLSYGPCYKKWVRKLKKKTVFILNSFEHENIDLHKYQNNNNWGSFLVICSENKS